MKRDNRNNPSTVWYWKDWENDEALRVCSLAAQGLWMRLMCVAAKAEPYGYILINGADPGVLAIARLGSITEAEAEILLSELERAGVFSRDRRGRMFSRRMVREAATARKNRENGKKGGNPSLSRSHGKTREKTGSVNPEDNRQDKAPYPIPQSHTQEEKKEGGGGGTREGPVSPPDDPDFADIDPPAMALPQTHRETLLAAMGADPVSGIIGPNGRMLGRQEDMVWAVQWTDLGLSVEDQVGVIREVLSGKTDGPPKSFKYFNPAMARLIQARRAAPIEINPAESAPTRTSHHGSNDRFNEAFRRLVDGVASGAIHLDDRESDPFRA